MQLSNLVLNRTLWLRQHLLTPARRGAVEMVHHLLGLQAQENLPPYLSLAARIEGFAPEMLSEAIADRRLVRLLSMRGTVHVLTPGDALTLRPWVQPALDRVSRTNPQSRPATGLPADELLAAVRAALSEGPLPVAELGVRLSRSFPSVPEAALRHIARERAPLLQVPPRGLWKRSGGVVYEHADTWLGHAFGEPDLPALVRRYLRAFGPASAADMTAWSGVTRLGAAFAAMDDLVRHTDEAGKTLYDVPDAPFADEGTVPPARLLGTYDNLWLSHAARDRVTTPGKRKQWMGVNGGTGRTLFVDGMLEGLWRVAGGRVELRALRRFTRAEQAAVDAETARVEEFLAR